MLDFKIDYGFLVGDVIITDHALTRMMERSIFLDRVLDILEGAEELFDAPMSLLTKGVNIGLYSKQRNVTVCLFVQIQGDKIELVVKTVFRGRSKYDKEFQPELEVEEGI